MLNALWLGSFNGIQCLNAQVRTQVRSMPYSHVRALRELHVKRSATDLRPGEAKRIGRTGREPISRTGEVKSSSGRAAMFVAAKTFFVRNLEISPHSHSNYSNYDASPTEPNAQDPPRSPNLRPRRPGGPVSDQSRFYVSKVPV